jgi:hypothetical protein
MIKITDGKAWLLDDPHKVDMSKEEEQQQQRAE